LIDDEELRKLTVFKKMLVFFNGNEERVLKWFDSPNNHLPGESSPRDLIEADMLDELNKWVEDCLAGYRS
jgi:hypothetical protein